MQPFNHFGLALFASVASLALAGEIGLRLGRRHRGHSDAEGRSQISMVEGALLGLLALLLGFTFSMAAGRYDVRQELVTREANAIGTVALRSDFLPEASRKAFRNTLLAYAEIRMEFVRAGVNEEELAKALETANRLEAELWTAAMETTRPGSSRNACSNNYWPGRTAPKLERGSLADLQAITRGRYLITDDGFATETRQSRSPVADSS